MDLRKVIVNGGAMALSHSIGTSGFILIDNMFDELERHDKKFGLITMCTVGEMASAIIIEGI